MKLQHPEQRPFCVGLTGGVGCGKSAVAERFARYAVPIIDTDLIARDLTAAGGAAMPAIVRAFGEQVVSPTGALDRALMRKWVFSDLAEQHVARHVVRHKLEAILHPLIRAEALRQLLAVTSVYAILVVPLLVENFAAYRPLLQRILLVDCDESQQIERTAARPGLDVTQARAIVAAQVSQHSRRALADDLIDNRGDFVHLDDQVARLHAEYLKLAARISSSS